MFLVPTPFATAIGALGTLEQEDFEALKSGLEALPDFASRKSVEQTIERSAGGWLNAVALTEAVTSLLAQMIDMPSAELAAGVVDSLDASLTEPGRDTLIERLECLLSCRAILSIGKATDVLTDHEHVFRRARILTDVRPVFGQDVATLPEAAVIVATLRIDHATDGKRKSSYFAMDRTDLEGLKEVVDRALIKSDSLVQFLATAGLTHYEPHAEGPNENV